MSTLGAFICLFFAGTFLLCAGIVFVDSYIKARWWRRFCKCSGGEPSAKQVVESIENGILDGGIKLGFRELDRTGKLDDLVRFDRRRGRDFQFTNRGRPVDFKPDGGAA